MGGDPAASQTGAPPVLAPREAQVQAPADVPFLPGGDWQDLPSAPSASVPTLVAVSQPPQPPQQQEQQRTVHQSQPPDGATGASISVIMP